MDTKHNHKLIAWLSLARDARFSILQKHQLLSHFSCPSGIYQTQYRDLCALLGSQVRSPKDTKFHADIDSGIEQDLRWLRNPNNHLVCWGDKYYPDLLAQITDPPVCLFASGNLALLSEPKVSVVGSRRPTPVGAKLSRSIATDLARLGIVISF